MSFTALTSVVVPTLLALLPAALGFSFSIGQPSLSQCGMATIQWSGGVPPFYMTVIPAYDYPTNVSIPNSAWSSNSQTGTWSWTVDYPSSTNLVFAMSDGTGFATGGVSSIYNVASSSNSSACTLRSTSTDFLFYLNETAVTQCAPVEIYWDATAKEPVSILGVIPGGQAFELQSSSSTDALVWQVNIASGTQFVLSAWDKGTSGQGGTSPLLTVAGSSNDQCINSGSPSSTPAVATSTSSGSTTSTKKPAGVVTVTAIQTSPSSGSGLSTGSIVGVVVGVLLVVLAIQGALVWFCCRRNIVAMLSNRRAERDRRARARRSKAGDVDLLSNYGGSDRPSNYGQGGSRLTLAIPGQEGDEGSEGERLRSMRSRSSIRDAPEEENSISPFLDPDGLRPVSGPSSPMHGPWDRLPDELGGWGGAHPHAPLPAHSPAPFEGGDLSASSRGGHTLPPGATYAQGSAGSSRFPYPLPSNPHKRALLAQNPDDDGSHVSPFGSEFELRSPSGIRPFVPGPLAGTETYTGSSGTFMSTNTGGAGSTMSGYELLGGGERGERGIPERGIPPHAAPRGGFRRHEDAGPMVEDLPPVYNPAWTRVDEGSDSEGGEGGRVRQGVSEREERRPGVGERESSDPEGSL